MKKSRGAARNDAREPRRPIIARGLPVSFVLCAAMLLVGCQAPPAADGPTRMTLHIADYDTFLDDALSLLRRADYPPDYVDRSQGLIISEPATAAQWFEPWRIDAPGPYQTLEASMHTIRKRVTVRLLPSGADVADDTLIEPIADMPARGPFDVRVLVEKHRYSTPERQITTASGALSMYSNRIPTTAGVRARGQHAWVSLGRDVLMEERLLDRLAALAPATTDEAPVSAPATQP